MKKVIIVGLIPLLFACSTMEFETPPAESVLSAYINKDFWAADSLTEAYYFENFLYISAYGADKSIIIKIENPVVGDNLNAEVDYINGYTGEVTKSASLSVYLNVLDTINAQPSIVNGTFNGQISVDGGKAVQIQEGKINNAVTKDLFCENNIRSMISSNSQIGGQWELVRIINRKTSQIQNPTCDFKVVLNMYNENNTAIESGDCDCYFRIEGPQNALNGNFSTQNNSGIGFYNVVKSDNETTKYNTFFEALVFESISTCKSYYINNSLMHLESDDYVVVFYRKK